MPCPRLVLVGVLPCGACHWLGPADWDDWRRDHGVQDSGDTAVTDTSTLPQDPPDTLCSEEWGTIVTTMVDQDMRSVSVGSSMALKYDFQGRGDLCEEACDADWVDPIVLTTLENYNDPDGWVEIPHRLQHDEVLFAVYTFAPGGEMPENPVATCWMNTSTGRYTTSVTAVTY